MDHYDTVDITSVEAGDQIFFNQDYIEVKEVLDETDTIMVTGYSHVSGDNVVYFIKSDERVDLWAV